MESIKARMKILLVFLVCLIQFMIVHSLEADLIDTRTATSDVGWVTPQGSEWQEASSSHEDGSERRVLMVCRMHKSRQNNWVRSPYIPINGAKRIYVEFEFTMRSCEDVPNVATCKETFNLYYYETDRDEATSTFPPWEESTYTKVDTIAADNRFHRGTVETNLETRDLGPLSKNGVYIALQDTGACMAIMHMRVYYKYCKPVVQKLAQFPKTLAGPERTSLVETEGVCVDSASKGIRSSPSLYCNSNGDWAVPKGECSCDPGFTPNQNQTTCQACGRGLFKSVAGNTACLRCPAYSHSRSHGSTICDCMFGYFRATSDDPTSACTKPPSKPTNLKAIVNKTSAFLTWSKPVREGGRDDLYYRVECKECRELHFCAPCSTSLDFVPAHDDLHVTEVKVQGLRASTHYKFKVFAENGVSDNANSQDDASNSASISITTKYSEPLRITDIFVVNIDMTSFFVVWSSPENPFVTQYDVIVFDHVSREPVMRNKTSQTEMMISNLKPGGSYSIEVRAGNDVGFGPFSAPLAVNTMKMGTTPQVEARKTDPSNFVAVVIGVASGVVCVIVVLVIICCYRRRTHTHEKKREFDIEKFPMFTESSLVSNGSYPPSQKIYIDPTVYDDPHKAISDFTRELDVSSIKINSVIGGGEFGDVCLGSIIQLGREKTRQVAIKTLKAGCDTPQKHDFLGEASIMGQFEHPNVIHLEGVVTKSRPLMIITEYMENGSLDEFLKKKNGQLTVLQLVGMLRNISEGMKYLSEMGYVHRDLAARNILVNSRLVCKVSDFGMSRVLEDDEDAAYTTRGGKIPIRWTAPEAITFRKFTSASDVWSYGIVMWEVMSYGERPYWGMSNRDVIQAVESGYRLPAPVDCPLIQHHLMLECWKKNRNERPKFQNIVLALENMVRDPSSLKIVAGISVSNSGRLVPTAEAMSLPVIKEEEKSLSFKYTTSTPVSKLASHTFPLSSLDLSFLELWLTHLGLQQYKENFLQSACFTEQQISQLNLNDLCRLGVTDDAHQSIFLDSIYSLKNNKDYHKKEALLAREDNGEGISV